MKFISDVELERACLSTTCKLSRDSGNPVHVPMSLVLLDTCVLQA